MAVVVRSDIGDFAILTLNRPNQLNAIDRQLVTELEEHFLTLETDASRGIVLTGAGRAFCAGTDLKQEHQDTDAWLERIHGLITRISEFDKPIVAALNGLTLGGGLEFATACLFRIAAPSVRLGLPEIKLGLIPSYGGTQRISQLLGQNRALELMLSGEPLTAGEAKNIGLVNLVARQDDTLLDEAMAYLGKFSRHSRVAAKAIKTAVINGASLSHGDALRLEASLAIEVSKSEDAREGVAAFLEKREPVWKDS